jgi:hypothetical protein
MSNVIRFKRRAAGGAAGAPGALKSGEPAWNNADQTLYLGAGDDGAGNATSVVPVGGSGCVNGQGFLKDNNTITVTGDATGSGKTAIVLTLKNTGIAGTYVKVTTDAQGRVTSGSGLSSSDVTSALGFTPSDAAKEGAANGVATLDATGKVPASQLPAAIAGGINFQGTWNAATNTPTLTSSTGNKGDMYKVSVAGGTALNGLTQWNVGDMAVFDGTVWDKLDGLANEVLSVAGRTGAVTLSASDISGLSANATAAVAAVANGGTGLSAAISGLVKGAAGAYTAAVVDTDYLSPTSVLDGGTF